MLRAILPPPSKTLLSLAGRILKILESQQSLLRELTIATTILAFYQPQVTLAQIGLEVQISQECNNPLIQGYLAFKGWFQCAELRLAQGDKVGAIADYSKAIQVNPYYAMAYLKRGNVRYEMGDKEGAIKDYNKVTEIDPKYGLAYYNLGVAFFDLGRERELGLKNYKEELIYSAINNFTAAIEKDPSLGKPYLKRAQAILYLQNIELKESGKVEIKEGEILFTGLVNIDDYHQVVKDCTQYLQYFPQDSLGYFIRAIARSNISQALERRKVAPWETKFPPEEPSFTKEANELKELAIEDLSQAVRLKPDYAEAYYQRATLREKLSKLERKPKVLAGRKEVLQKEALEDYKEVLRLDPDVFFKFNSTKVEGYLKRAEIRRQIGDYQGALEDYKQASLIKTKDPEIFNKRGLILLDLEREQEAIADFDEALSLKSDYAEAYYNRGVAYSKLGDEKEAIDDYDLAIRYKSDYAEAYYDRGISHSKSNNLEEAKKDLKKAAALFFKQGNMERYRQAIDMIKTLKETQP